MEAGDAVFQIAKIPSIDKVARVILPAGLSET